MRKGLHFVELRTLDGKIFSNLFCWAQCGKSKKWCWPVVSDWFWCEELLFTYDDTHHYQILNLNLHTLQKRVEMWFHRLILIPNMQRPWWRKRRGRVEPSSSLHAALLSCTGTILVVVHLENHYFHHHHTPHRCLARKVVLMGMLVMIIKSRFLIRVWRYPYWNEIAGNRGVKMVVEGGGCEDDGGIFTSTISW